MRSYINRAEHSDHAREVSVNMMALNAATLSMRFRMRHAGALQKTSGLGQEQHSQREADVVPKELESSMSSEIRAWQSDFPPFRLSSAIFFHKLLTPFRSSFCQL